MHDYSLIPQFFTVELYSIVWEHHSSLIHLTTEGHLSCFQVLTIMNQAAIIIYGQVFL